MTTDQMLGHHDADLFDIAPNGGSAEIECPAVLCGKTYWVQGGYIPTYTSATSEDDL